MNPEQATEELKVLEDKLKETKNLAFNLYVKRC